MPSSQDAPSPPPADGSSSQPSPPALDPTVVIRSRPYLSALVLAAILGIPISAVAYGFLALIDKIQTYLFTDLPQDLFTGAAASVVAHPFRRAVRAPGRADHPLPTRQRRALAGFRLQDRRSAGRP